MAAPSQYVRIDSALASNDKVLNLADDLWLEATGLYILMVCRCDLGSTDGSLDVKAVVGARGIAPGRDDLLAEIVRVKLARRRGDIVTIPDYLEWQRSSEEKLSATERARKAGRLRHSKGKKDASGNASGNASGTASGKRAFCSAEPASKQASQQASKPDGQNPVEEEGDVPESVSLYASLLQTYQRVTCKVPSQNDRRVIQGWATFRKSPEAVEDALKAAIDNKARNLAAYATAILDRGPQPQDDYEPFKGVNLV